MRVHVRGFLAGFWVALWSETEQSNPKSCDQPKVVTRFGAERFWRRAARRARPWYPGQGAALRRWTGRALASTAARRPACRERVGTLGAGCLKRSGGSPLPAGRERGALRGGPATRPSAGRVDRREHRPAEGRGAGRAQRTISTAGLSNAPAPGRE